MPSWAFPPAWQALWPGSLPKAGALCPVGGPRPAPSPTPSLSIPSRTPDPALRLLSPGFTLTPPSRSVEGWIGRCPRRGPPARCGSCAEAEVATGMGWRPPASLRGLGRWGSRPRRCSSARPGLGLLLPPRLRGRRARDPSQRGRVCPSWPRCRPLAAGGGGFQSR